MTTRPEKRTKPGLRLVKTAANEEKVIAKITTEPRLLPIKLEYELDNATLNGRLSYNAWIEYSDHGRRDRSPVVSGSSGSLSFSVNFGTEIQGGTLHVDAVVPYKQSDGSTGSLSTSDTWGNVLGQNPSKAVTKAYLGDIEFQVIAYIESENTFGQFYDVKEQKDEKIGLPRYSRKDDGGFGLMQLTKPPPTARQIWDWKQNVDAGKALLINKRKEVEQHFKNEREKHPEARELTQDEFKLAFYQYYNGGYYWAWDAANGAWKKVDKTGYADLCLRFEKLVLAGNPPSGWND